MIALQAHELLVAFKRMVPFEIKEYYWAGLSVWSSPKLWLLIGVVLVWERLQPADPKQPWFGRATVQDFLWFNVDIALGLALIPAVAGGIDIAYKTITGGYTLPIASGWPTVLALVFSVLFLDFLHYVKHSTLHRLTPLWHFHVIHHSQRAMSIFTDRRQHVFELILTQLMVVLPLTILGLKPMAVMTVGALFWWHTMLVHANIRTNFGVLGWIFVSPQFHRVHHSIEVRHWDKNYGAFVTLWDRMFGTMYQGGTEYPDTGVATVDFPPPHTMMPHAWLADMGRQLLYPFRAMRTPRR